MTRLSIPDHDPAPGGELPFITNHNPIEAALLSLMEKWATEGATPTTTAHHGVHRGLIGLASEPTIRQDPVADGQGLHLRPREDGAGSVQVHLQLGGDQPSPADRAMPPARGCRGGTGETILTRRAAGAGTAGEPRLQEPAHRWR